MLELKPKPVFLRWAGSKKQLLPILLDSIPNNFSRYVEPFSGSACLFFSLKPERALLGDVNGELISTYEAVRDYPKAVARELHQLEICKENYYFLRSLTPKDLRKVPRAARFIFLNRLCFNGLYRTNLLGQFNVPFGGIEGGQLPSTNQLLAAASILKSAELKACDFERVLEEVVPTDFVYMDPPYSVKAQRTFREYSPTQFGENQLTALKSWMDVFERKGVPFLVSYADCDEARSLGKGFRTRHVEARRNIAGFHAHRRKAMECLISNF